MTINPITVPHVANNPLPLQNNQKQTLGDVSYFIYLFFHICNGVPCVCLGKDVVRDYVDHCTSRKW